MFINNYSCSTEEESEVPSSWTRDGLYILCENNVSFYTPLNNNSNDPIDITSQIGLSFNNPKKLELLPTKCMLLLIRLILST